VVVVWWCAGGVHLWFLRGPQMVQVTVMLECEYKIEEYKNTTFINFAL